MSKESPTSSEGQAVKSKSFSKSNMNNHSYVDCTFENCDFTESAWQNAKFCTCTFVNCNISLVKLDGCRLQDVRFVSCKIVGAEFFKSDKTFFSPHFKNCLLQYCNFSDLNLKNCTFNGSKITEGYFTNAILVGAKFSEVDLSGTTFHNCDLTQADFSTAKLYDIDPRTNIIKKAKFSFPEAIGLLRAFDITIV